MVEKIIVNPESVRAYGNIVLPKTGADFEGVDCTVLVDTDTVNDELVTVYSLESEATILNVVLSVDDGSVMIGDTVTLSASVTDEMTSPVVGASVSFRLNGSVVGSSDTNSSGVATLSYQCNSAGSLSFTGVCNNFTSNSVSVTVTGHSYSLSFDSTDYTVVGGSVVMMVSLSDYGTSVSGASVSLSGGGSSWSATTDSTGVATFNLSNVTVGGTYTASYGGASTTCNVVIQTYLFYDPCNTTYDSSKYGTIIKVSSSTTTNYTAYDSTNNCYKTRANGDWGVLPITALASADNYKIEALFKRPSTNALYQGGFSWTNPSNPNGDCWFVRMRGDGKIDYGTKNSSQTTVVSNLGSAWIKIELTVQGQSIGIKVYDGDTLKGSATATNPISNSVIGLHLIAGSSYGFYVKEIKAEAI